MIVFAWFIAFVWTCALELPIYAFGIPRKGTWILRTVFLLYLTTHPCLWFVAPKVLTFEGWIYVAEILIWLTEGLILTALLRGPLGKRLARGMITALIANLFSYLVGIPLSNLLFG